MKNTKKLKEKFLTKCSEKLKKSGKSIKDIAKATTIAQSTVEDFFNGKSDTKIGTVIRILNVLNCELKV